jgi:hypothetical protein
MIMTTEKHIACLILYLLVGTRDKEEKLKAIDEIRLLSKSL